MRPLPWTLEGQRLVVAFGLRSNVQSNVIEGGSYWTGGHGSCTPMNCGIQFRQLIEAR